MAYTNISEWAADDLVAVHAGARDSTGFFAGYGKLTAADTGESSGMRRIKAAITAPMNVQGVEFAPVPGDGGIVARFARNSGDANEFTLEHNARDLDFEAFLQGSAKLVIGEWDMGILGSTQRNPQDTLLMLTRKAQSMETATKNAPGYENLLVPSVTIIPIGDDQFAYQEIGGSRYPASASKILILPWGATVASGFTLTDGETIGWSSEYPCVLQAFVGDGTITAIPLDYAPISVAKTKAFLFSTGAALTVSSVNVGSKTATLSAAPASGAIVLVIQETLTF